MFNIDTASKPHRAIAVIASFLFAVFFSMVDWESVHGSFFVDREVYFSIFRNAPDFEISFSFFQLVAFIVNEQLWSQLIRGLHENIGLSLTTVFGVISFLLVFSYAYFVSSRVGPLAILLLINPLLVDLAFSQLRMSLAMVFLLIAFNCNRWLYRLPFLLIGCFIHTASFLFVIMALCVFVSVSLAEKYRLNRFNCYFLLVFTGFCIALVVGPLRTFILEQLGDRRIVYDAPATTWTYASVWVAILAVAALQLSAFFRNHVNAIALVFLSVYTFCTLFSVYGLRFLAASLPFFVVALCRFGSFERAFVVLIFAAYTIVQWVYWIR